MDEMGINLDLARSHGRAPSGERLVEKRPVNTPASTSVIGALGAKGMLASLAIEGAVDGECFARFVEECLAPHLRPGHLVFMDNVATHKSERVEKAIGQTGAVLLFLPPYSPDFNPIEECWSKIKAGLRAIAARTKSKLFQGLRKVLTQIQPSDIRGWFSHCGYNFSPN